MFEFFVFVMLIVLFAMLVVALRRLGRVEEKVDAQARGVVSRSPYAGAPTAAPGLAQPLAQPGFPPGQPGPYAPVGAPGAAQPAAPQGAQPAVPQGAQPTVPQGAQPAAPQGAQPTVPQGAQPIAPQSAQPIAPQGAQPIAPQGAQPIAPQGVPVQPAAPGPFAPPAPQAVPVTMSFPAPAGAPVAAPAPAAPAPAAHAPAAHAPAVSLPPRAPQQPPKPTAPKASMENVFGRNILGVVASVLVFIGLIVLGYLVVPYLSDTTKIVLMFAFSAIMTAAGYLLNHRYSNNFTQAFLGTGLGAFFISVMITHLYFGAIDEYVAFTMLAVWTAAALFVARQTNSLLIGIIAHAGMVASVCAGYLTVASDDKIVFLVVYQFVSTAIIVAGNIVCCRRMYRFGLFATLALMVFSSVVMWFRFGEEYAAGFSSTLPPAVIVAAFVAQFVAGTFLAYLLFVSCVRVKNADAGGVLQFFNVGLWLLLLGCDVSVLAVKLTATSLGRPMYWLDFGVSHTADLVGLLAGELIMALVALATILVRRKVKFPQVFESVTVLVLGLAAAVGLLINLYVMGNLGVAGPHLSYLVVVGVLLVMGGRLAGNRAIAVGGRALLAADAFVMMLVGYDSLIEVGGVWLAVGYLALLAALGYFAWRWFTPEFRSARTKWYRLGLVLAFEVSLGWIATVAHDTAYGWAMWALMSIALLAVLHLLKMDVPVTVYRLGEFFLALIICGQAVLGVDDPVAQVLRTVAAAVCFVLFVERVRVRAAENALALRERRPLASDAIEYTIAIGMLALVLGVLRDLGDSWFTWYYPASLAALVVALVIISLGFWSRTRALRLSGLIVIIACVLKLVTTDTWGTFGLFSNATEGDRILQVVAFIGGGLVCFGVSALYNFAVKRFDQADDEARAGLGAPTAGDEGCALMGGEGVMSGARLATRGSRAVRAVLHGALWLVLTVCTAAGVSKLLGFRWEVFHWTDLSDMLNDLFGFGPYRLGWLMLALTVPCLGFWGLVGLAWVAVGGRTPVDAGLGLRLVRVDACGPPGGRALLRGIVVGTFGLFTAGLVPLLLAVGGRGADGRHWQDRWSGLALLDVRAATSTNSDAAG